MSVDYRVGDVRDRLAEIPDGSVDLVTCSPPFLALRSYLPADHDAKHAEIGSEPTPAEFLATLLGLAREWRRILTPTGSIAIELGDTFAGSGGGGGDYLPGGMRDGQQQFAGSGATMRESNAAHWRTKAARRDAWPLSKSLCGIPTLFTWSLAYGRNLLARGLSHDELLDVMGWWAEDGYTAAECVEMGRRWAANANAHDLGPSAYFEPWRVRNVIVWARPNPAVGALGDKFRPATSYITVACPSDKRWFDLDAVRTAAQVQPTRNTNGGKHGVTSPFEVRLDSNPAGAPPLDHWTDDPTDPDDGDLTWKLSTEGSSLAHYAMWPSTLAARIVDSMCPRQVCTVCGEPRRRVVRSESLANGLPRTSNMTGRSAIEPWRDINDNRKATGATFSRSSVTLGWSDCGHDSWRPGVVLDCFGGTGTSGAVADLLGRDAILIDLDARNAALYPRRRAEVERKLNPTAVAQVPGQLGLLDEVAS